MRRSLVLGASLGFIALGMHMACVGDTPVTPPADGGKDVTTSDVTTGDVATTDSPQDAPQDAGTVYNSFGDSTKWEQFDTATVNATLSSFDGATFDGRYIYFVPSSSGLVARYDTQGSFTAAASWTSFDTKSLTGAPFGFSGAVFDGRYVYLVPQQTRLLTRYDTTKDFSASSSWTTADLNFFAASANATIGPLAGGAFDGRYVYLAPLKTTSSFAARYDTLADFAQPGSFQFSNVGAQFSALSLQYFGAAFDGHYVYYADDTVAASSAAASRFDTTQGSFAADAGAWSTYPMSKTFAGLGFDGRYLYEINSTVAQYDTQGSFTATGSWVNFDLTLLDGGAQSSYATAGFDGRYLYVVPASGGMFVRYDTQASFNTAGSWTILHGAPIDAGTTAYAGAVFDGQHIYFIPNASGVVLRFDAKQPGSMPKLCSNVAALNCYTGSFY